VEEPAPRPSGSEPARPLAGWLWRFGLVGAAVAPLVAMGVGKYGWLDEGLLYLSPILGLAVGAVCGLAGWGFTRAVGA
jgi:hypothetical protein